METDPIFFAVVALALLFVTSAAIFGTLLTLTDWQTMTAIAFAIAIFALIGAILIGTVGHKPTVLLFN